MPDDVFGDLSNCEVVNSSLIAKLNTAIFSNRSKTILERGLPL